MAATLFAAEGLAAAASTSKHSDGPVCCHGRSTLGTHQPSRPQLSTRAQISRHCFCFRQRVSQQSVQCFAAPGSLQERASDERTGSFGEDYSVGELLGMGSFGKVYRAISRTDPGTGFAVKIVPKHREGVLDERIARRIHEEVDVLRQLQSRPEAVRLAGVYEDEDRVCIVTELCEGGDLEHFLKDYGHMTEPEAAHAAHDILRVLRECHAQGICYADVKPANFLLKRAYSRRHAGSPPLELRVVDFGCSQRLQESGKLHKRTGTPLYMAPELFMRYYGTESDQWAMGILVYQLLSGHLPFWDAQSDRSPLAVMSAILNQEVRYDGKEWGGISEEAKDFVLRLLDRDYNSRMSAEQALEHPWIAQHCGEDGCSAPSELVNA